MNYYMELIEKLGADGIDFVPIMIPKEEAFKHIIVSYTKKELESIRCIP